MSSSPTSRFDSWKEIAQCLGRDLRTVQRWEAQRGLPVHRVPGSGRQAVFAYKNEIDGWLQAGATDGGQNAVYRAVPDREESPPVSLDLTLSLPEGERGQPGALADAAPRVYAFPIRSTNLGPELVKPKPKHRWAWLALAGPAVLTFTFLLYRFPLARRHGMPSPNLKFTRLTTNGKAQEAAISPDGKYVVYVSGDPGGQSLWGRQVATRS